MMYKLVSLQTVFHNTKIKFGRKKGERKKEFLFLFTYLGLSFFIQLGKLVLALGFSVVDFGLT